MENKNEAVISVAAAGQWEGLAPRAAQADTLIAKFRKIRRTLLKTAKEIEAALQEFNKLRLEHLLGKMREENKAFCTLHAELFPESTLLERLFPVEEVEVCTVSRSWSRTCGGSDHYSGDPYTVHGHDRVVRTGCKLYRRVTQNSLETQKWVTYCFVSSRKADWETLCSCFPNEWIEALAAEWGMPKVEFFSGRIEIAGKAAQN